MKMLRIPTKNRQAKAGGRSAVYPSLGRWARKPLESEDAYYLWLLSLCRHQLKSRTSPLATRQPDIARLYSHLLLRREAGVPTNRINDSTLSRVCRPGESGLPGEVIYRSAAASDTAACGETMTPGPIVDESTTVRIYWPLAVDGLAFMIASINV